MLIETHTVTLLLQETASVKREGTLLLTNTEPGLLLDVTIIIKTRWCFQWSLMFTTMSNTKLYMNFCSF